MGIVLLLYLLFIVAPIGTVIHEFGHLIGANIVRAEKIVLSIGLGKRFSSISFKNITLHFHRVLFLAGSVNSSRTEPYTPFEKICITMFGPLNNIFFTCLFYFLYLWQPTIYVKLLLMFNLWLAIINIIPFKIGNRKSDGYIILKTILHS